MSIFRKLADGVLNDVWDFVDDGYWEKREYPYSGTKEDYTMTNRIHFKIYQFTINRINGLSDIFCYLDRFINIKRV